ncbi:RdgB/HAM1 family non-canonical purine NTP pyrophosphatase [Pedobacter antarcticus]|uniref:RdgB/HAM1 family non-canonical purine NTP pyrophosphatase n=1 Tax=Pedobacter antarcticus TaxID=34086 RepID=UPI00292D4812|nr:RdgB/HAM1 family non-canonical purine NTP pyrophosphatase [Pedobacter antarcticus]
MSRKLVFATQNKHKTQEVSAILKGAYEVLNLLDIGCTTDIPETASSFAGNASLKSKYVAENFGLDCFADDSGLEVKALKGEPGIYSARYAGGGDDQANLELVLKKMNGVTDRRARFVTVISLLMNGKEYFFEGRVNGTLREEPSGTAGFGYDPIFQPDGYSVTFAEMSGEEKNAISHRGLAMKQLIAFLNSEII